MSVGSRRHATVTMSVGSRRHATVTATSRPCNGRSSGTGRARRRHASACHEPHHGAASPRATAGVRHTHESSTARPCPLAGSQVLRAARDALRRQEAVERSQRRDMSSGLAQGSSRTWLERRTSFCSAKAHQHPRMGVHAVGLVSRERDETRLCPPAQRSCVPGVWIDCHLGPTGVRNPSRPPRNGASVSQHDWR
jgi:hypothetical protein